MKLVGEYALFPGHCFFTGSSDTSHGVLDTEHDIDYDGHVYMSGKLLEEAAGLLGWVPPDRHAEVKLERDELAARVAELETRLENLAGLEDIAELVVMAKAEAESVDAKVA